MNSPRMSKLLTSLCFGLSLVASLPALAAAQASDAGANQKVRNIVLVHGAWANGSSWSEVIPLLEARGFHVVAANMPLTSLQNDDDAVERSIEQITQTNPGPVLLVGHSYGGVVIGDVPGNDPRVVGLVYVAAFAPDTGQSALSLLGTLSSPPPINSYLVFGPPMTFDPQTPTWISDEGIARASAHDDVITAGLEQQEAQTIGAKAIELPTCHVATLQEPGRVADFISNAAES